MRMKFLHTADRLRAFGLDDNVKIVGGARTDREEDSEDDNSEAEDEIQSKGDNE